MSDPNVLYQDVSLLIRDGYAEQSRYVLVMTELLKTGLAQFTRDLAMTRQWADRVLAMLEDARRVRPLVEEVADAAKRRFDRAVVKHLSDPAVMLPKKLDAGQRQVWACSFFTDLEDDAKVWLRLHLELKAFIESSDKKFRHLVEAKHDLRSQLWAVRLHGILGDLTVPGMGNLHDLHQDGRELEDESVPPYRRHPNQIDQGDVILGKPTQPPDMTKTLSLTELAVLLEQPKKE
jgi:hypothetical protein